MKRLLLFIFIVSFTTTAAAQVIERPTVGTKNCTEAKCHAQEMDHKVLHGPTSLGACDACHIPADVQKHTFALKQQGKALCDFCHVEKKAVGTHLHKPVAEGQCLSCHNPHGAATKQFLRKDTVGALCMDCHKDVTQKRQHLHGPVEAGSCMACHNAHSSDVPKLLVAEGRELCITCHDQTVAALKTAKSVHKPMAGDCQQCHEVHASNFKNQLKAEPVALCESCHKEVKQQIADAKFKHSAVSTDKACMNCHQAHSSMAVKLVKDNLPAACMTCHDKPLATADKRPVPAVLEVLNKELSQHGPIRQGNCGGCHALHGGQVTRLLAKPYPETFYEAFDINKYALCFTCHDKALVLEAKSASLTNFRNGSQNLHFLHVNNPEKGRSCRACHATHASTHEFHVRDSVTFGKWELPINFEPTKTGGSCAPGCHKEARYDRETPILRGGTPLARPPATLPTAEKR